jgi:hypothetical protein
MFAIHKKKILACIIVGMNFLEIQSGSTGDSLKNTYNDFLYSLGIRCANNLDMMKQKIRHYNMFAPEDFKVYMSDKQLAEINPDDLSSVIQAEGVGSAIGAVMLGTFFNRAIKKIINNNDDWSKSSGNSWGSKSSGNSWGDDFWNDWSKSSGNSWGNKSSGNSWGNKSSGNSWEDDFWNNYRKSSGHKSSGHSWGNNSGKNYDNDYSNYTSNPLKSAYETLNIKPGATQAEAKKAYFNLMKKYHPDTNKNPSAVKKSQEINSAWDLIKNSF